MNVLLRAHLRVSLLVILGASLAPDLRAQAAPQPSAAVQPGADDPGVALSRNLATLSRSPNSLDALLGAGNAAVALGDPEAALTFLGKAEELAPRDGRVKAAIGSALVMMEQGRTALRFFEEARTLGAAEADYAGYRGLAFDLTGDTVRAQRDYRLSLTRREDPEVRRRFALSMAISGNREAALAAIDGQLRRQDRAAWRARAFILALTGDTAGATQAVQAVMPAQASAMAPFLARLPLLSPADRALAVNFGHFPGSAQTTQLAGVSTTARPITAPPLAPVSVSRPTATTSAGTPDAGQTPLGAVTARSVGAAVPPATVPVSVAPSAAPVTSTARPSAITAPPTSPVQPATSGVTAATRIAPGPVANPVAGPPVVAAPSSASPATILPSPSPSLFAPALTNVSPTTPALQPALPSSGAPAPISGPSSALASTVSIQSTPLAASTIAPSVLDSAPTAAIPSATAQPPAPSPVAAAPARNFADVATLVASLSAASDDTVAITPEAAKPLRAAPPGNTVPSARSVAAVDRPSPATAGAAKPAAKPAPSAKTGSSKPAKPVKEPARTWVQIAHAGSPSVLPGQYDRIKSRAPKLFAGRTAWTASQKGNNRLLVGPFKSDKEAQAFVSQLTKAKVEAFSWASPVGLEIKKLK